MKSKKAKLRAKADHLWTEIILCREPFCEVCREPSKQAHHFFPKNLYPQLRYDLQNGIGLCMRCHFFHHHRGEPSIHATILNHRGPKWFQRLKKKSKKKFKPSFQNTAYYEKVINQLNAQS